MESLFAPFAGKCSLALSPFRGERGKKGAEIFPPPGSVLVELDGILLGSRRGVDKLAFSPLPEKVLFWAREGKGDVR